MASRDEPGIPFMSSHCSAASLMLEENYFTDDNSEDLSYSDLDSFPEFLLDRAQMLRSLQLDHNQVSVLPECIGRFTNLVTLDISNNHMTYLSADIVQLKNLRTLMARNNHFQDEAIPKDMGIMRSLEVVNFSSNKLKNFPMQFTEMRRLRNLHLGGNQIHTIPAEVGNMQSLEILYLGGNQLKSLPYEIGFLVKLTSLFLNDNQLESLPASMGQLGELQSLSLHNNSLSTLPQQIINLDLYELSLRNNPLVVRFVEDLVYQPPSLLELAGRTIKINNVPYTEEDIPCQLMKYLDSAQCCVNPNCKGVYFTSCVEHVKFVDFCGKYRLPLLEYLCSPTCSTSPVHYASSSDSESEEEEPDVAGRIKKVLLG